MKKKKSKVNYIINYRREANEIIKSIATSLKSKVIEIESKSPSRVLLQKFTTKKLDAQVNKGILTPSLLNISDSRTSYTSNSLTKQQKFDNESVKK